MYKSVQGRALDIFLTPDREVENEHAEGDENCYRVANDFEALSCFAVLETVHIKHTAILANMPEFRKRRTRAELLVKMTGIVAGACLLGLVAFWSIMAAWRMYLKLQDATDQSDAAASELALLQKQDAQVTKDIASLSSERGVEAALRERYGVIRPGEGIIQVVETSPAATSSMGTASQNLLERVFHTLFPW